MSEDPKGGEFDFTSDEFDAERSLANPSSVHLNFPDVKPCKKVQECLPLLPPDLREEIKQGEWLENIRRSFKSEEERARDKAKAEFMQQRAATLAVASAQEARYNPIQAIADRVRAGPLIVLKQLYNRAAYVDVVVRNVHGVRGVMRATLCGFDKYFNMLLADVHEIFIARVQVVRIKPKRSAPKDPPHDLLGAREHGVAAKTEGEEGRGEVGSSGRAEGARAVEEAGIDDLKEEERVQTRVGWKQELKQRRLSRIVLRGDHVVMVYRANGPIRLPGSYGQRFNHCLEKLSAS